MLSLRGRGTGGCYVGVRDGSTGVWLSGEQRRGWMAEGRPDLVWLEVRRWPHAERLVCPARHPLCRSAAWAVRMVPASSASDQVGVPPEGVDASTDGRSLVWAIVALAALLVLYVPYAFVTVVAGSEASLFTPILVVLAGMALLAWTLALTARGSPRAGSVSLLASALLVGQSALMFVIGFSAGDPSPVVAIVVLASGAVSFVCLGLASRAIHRGRGHERTTAVLIRAGQGIGALVLAGALTLLHPLDWVPSVGAWAFAFFVEAIRLMQPNAAGSSIPELDGLVHAEEPVNL